MDRFSRFGAVALAAGFLALHLPFLPASLEDLDSINFALGVRDFDVARHQPHPPGYPVFVFAGKVMHVLVASEAHALALIGIIAGAIAAVALVAVFRELDGARSSLSKARSLAAALLVLTAPLFYMTAARPLSDVAGLAVALVVQALLLRARTPRDIVLAGAIAAIGIGIRSQVAWLTLPILLWAIVRRPAADRLRTFAGVAIGFAVGVAIWAVPLVLLTGGPAAYLRTLFSQGAEDFTGVVMLWTTPTPRQLVRVLFAAFVAPWSFVPTAIIVLTLAAAGFAEMLRRGRYAFGMLVVLFGPYLVFDLVFQESATTRYALPIVIPIAYAAVRGAMLLTPWVAAPAIVGIAGFNAFVTTQALSGYARADAPAFRLLADMRALSAESPAPVLAMHRRDDLDMRRPIDWTAGAMPALERRLPAPPKHEWLELVKYWNGGGRQPVWFVADPPRSDLALVKLHGERREYRWPFNLPMMMGGARPGEMDWYVMGPPDWYLGEGWAITPETAGVAGEDGKGPGRGGIEGRIRRWQIPSTILIGGRNLGGPEAHVRIAIEGRTIEDLTVPTGFFLRLLPIPADPAAGDFEYTTITVTSDQDQLAIEQFDAQPRGRVMFGYGEGWNEQEYNPSTGELWRWTTEKATLRVKAEGRPLVVSLKGEIEEASSSHITIRVGDRIVSEQEVGRSFAIAADIPAQPVTDAETAIIIETSAWHVPAERRSRSQDRRHLGLKIYSCLIFGAS